MGEAKLCPGIYWTQIDLDMGFLAGFLRFAAMRPPPAHDQTRRLVDFKILASAFMLAAVQHPEAHPKASAHANIGFRHQYRPVVWSPPAGDPNGGGQGVEYYRGARGDLPHQGQSGHGFSSLPGVGPALASSASAYAASRSRRADQNRS